VPMRLYDYGPSANCLKARLIIDRLGIPCELVPTDIFTGETLTEDYLARNPDGRTPLLELDDGTCLAESNAIALYLAEGSDLVPEDPVERAQVMQWLFFEQNRLEPNVGTARFLRMTGRSGQRPEVLARCLESGESAIATLERHLASHDFLVGNRLTLADLVVGCYGSAGEGAGIDMAPYPAVRAWVGRLHEAGISTEVEPYPPNAIAGAGKDSVHGV
jgi:glutathione S-transferase